MRARTNRGAWATAVASAVWGTMAACGGENAPVDAVDASVPAVEAGAPDTSVAPPPDGGAPDAADAADAAPEASAALPSNPMQVTCGSSACATPNDACCATPSPDGGFGYVCQPENQGCQGGRLRCDERADCPDPTDVCCLRTDPTKPESTCENDCQGGNRIQICRTDAECAGGTCVVNRCPGGQVYQACIVIPGCLQ